jgi:hypothetical protein
MPPTNEVGRELKASELNPGTVVIVAPSCHPGAMLTVWVKAVDSKLVVFYAGELNLHIINFVQPDGSIQDDHGTVIRVYEYLGQA